MTGEPGTPAETSSGFVRALTLTDATMLVAGSMVGTGIYIVSAPMARRVDSPFWLLVAWGLTGAYTLLGALAYGELAAMYPRAGGQYVFLREGLGPLPAFLFGWTLFTVIQAGTIASVAVAFGRFTGVLWPALSAERYGWFPQADVCVPALGCSEPGEAIQLGLSPQRLLGLGAVWLLTWVNLQGVREGKRVQTTLTVLKMGTLGLLALLGLTLGRNSAALSANFSAEGFFGSTGPLGPFVLAFGASLVGSLFASDAWVNVTFAAAEVERPRRNLPLSLLLGTGLVTLLYLSINLAYLSVLPLRGTPEGESLVARGIQHATEDRVGTAVADSLFGGRGEAIMAVAILVSAFGCGNGLILSGARVFWAMARDGLFFQRMGTLNARAVPAASLLAQGVWTSLLCVTGTYAQLLDYVMFAGHFFYVLTTAGLFRLRKLRPDAERPYRALGYPVLPALHLLMSGGIALLLLSSPTTRAQALTGLLLVLLGIPVYLLWRRHPRSAERPGRPA